MARRKNSSKTFEGLIFLLIVAFGAATIAPFFLPQIDFGNVFVPMAALIILFGIFFLFIIKYFEIKRIKLLKIDDVDQMTGVEFEKYVGRILESKGYEIKFTKSSGDLGVDIIASKNGERTGIQAKRYIGTVSRKAISDVVGAKNHYGVTKTMVITTNFFTRDAKTLAASEGCQLVDRTELERWIIEFQSKRNSGWI